MAVIFTDDEIAELIETRNQPVNGCATVSGIVVFEFGRERGWDTKLHG